MSQTLDEFLASLAQEVKDHKASCPIHGGNQKKSIDEKIKEASEGIHNQKTLEKINEKDPAMLAAIFSLLGHDVIEIAKFNAALEMLVWRGLLTVKA